MLCDSCTWKKGYPEGTSHRWWHTLLPMDSRVLVEEPADLQPSSPTQSRFTDTDLIHTSLGNVNKKTAPAEPFDTLQFVNASSSLPDFGGLSSVTELVQKLDDRISSLEGKVDASLALTSETVAKSQVSVEERIGVLENRMASVEGKLDAILGELKRGTVC